MNDIEELVRATLTDPRRRLDPPAGHHQRVDERIGRARRRRRWRSAATLAGTVAVLLAGGLVLDARGPGSVLRPAGPPTPSSSPGRYSDPPPRLSIGPGEPRAVVASGDAFYVLATSPGALSRLDPASLMVTRGVSVAGDPQGIAADRAGGPLWAWSEAGSGALTVTEYDPGTLASNRRVPVPVGTIFVGTVLDGDLWLGTDKGLYRIRAGETTAQAVVGFEGQIFGLTADRDRRRILVDRTTSDGVRPVALDPATLAGTEGGVVRLGKEEIVVVAGQIWLGGFSSTGDPKLVRLDPITLAPVATGPVDLQLGPGAILWAGVSALWVRNGGDEGLSCLDPVTGAIRQQWSSVQGPVASLPGAAVALDGAFLRQPALADGCMG